MDTGERIDVVIAEPLEDPFEERPAPAEGPVPEEVSA